MGESLGNRVVLQELVDEDAIDRLALHLAKLDDARQVVPTARSDERLAIGRRFDGVEVVGLHLEVRQNRRMNACFERIGAPGFKVGLDGDLAQSVEGHHVEIVHRSVVLGRIARTYHNPSVGNLMSPESFELQKLQH